jgi:hypothetical protein
MLVKATPFLRLHGLDDAAVSRAMDCTRKDNEMQSTRGTI